MLLLRRGAKTRVLLFFFLLIFLLQTIRLTPVATRAALPLDDWPMFLHDVSRSSFNSDEVRLSPANAANLKVKWTFQSDGVMAAQPIVVGDMVYEGAWSGNMFAVDRETGQVRWKIDLGNTTGGNDCMPQTAGITSAPHVVDGVLYIGGGGAYKYALDAKTGTPIWRFYSGDNSAEGGAYNWDSPAVFNGLVYTGIASFCDRPFVQGKVWALNAKTGAVAKEVNLVRDGELGGGIWTSPTIDPRTRAVYVSTASGNHIIDTAYSMAVLDPQTLRVLSSWQLPLHAAEHDGDWSTTPTLFRHADGRTLVGAAAKDGLFRAFDSNRIGDGPVWTFRIADGGECPLCGEASISSSAYAYNRLYVAGGHITLNGQRVGGTVSALDPSTGQVIWRAATAGGIFGSVVVANHLVAIAADQDLFVLNADTGERLWTYHVPYRIYAAPTIAGGVLYAADTHGILYAFSAGPYAEPTATPVPPQPSTTASPTPHASAPPAAPALPGESQCFPETGKCLRGVFLDYWRKNGGLARFGFPVTLEVMVDGRVTQYTQRARFEQHTENQPPFNVLLGRLGAEATAGRVSEEPFKRTAQKPGQAYSPETGHNVSGPILQYWQANGGVPVFGYPLSEAFEERSQTDGKTYLVQYFERQRLEYHPENKDPQFAILLGLLGVETYGRAFGKLP